MPVGGSGDAETGLAEGEGSAGLRPRRREASVAVPSHPAPPRPGNTLSGPAAGRSVLRGRRGDAAALRPGPAAGAGALLPFPALGSGEAAEQAGRPPPPLPGFVGGGEGLPFSKGSRLS